MPVDDPPDVNPNDIVECTFKGTLCGQACLTVLHYRVDTEAPISLPTLLDTFNDGLQAAGKQKDKYIAAASANYTLDEIVLQVIKDVRFARFVYAVNEVGTQIDDATTADLACVIEKSTFFATDRTSGAERGFTGGIHYPAVPGTKIENGIIDQTYRDNEIDELAASLIDRVDIAGGDKMQPVIYHRSGAAPHYTDVTRYSIKREARVMRRRTVGRGI